MKHEMPGHDMKGMQRGLPGLEPIQQDIIDHKPAWQETNVKPIVSME